jgi:hypothetical protein
MPRLTTLRDVIFPVEEQAVFAIAHGPSGEHRLRVPEKKAIVNVDTQRVLGVVSRDYRLVTNEEARAWAFACCRNGQEQRDAGAVGQTNTRELMARSST